MTGKRHEIFLEIFYKKKIRRFFYKRISKKNFVLIWSDFLFHLPGLFNLSFNAVRHLCRYFYSSFLFFFKNARGSISRLLPAEDGSNCVYAENVLCRVTWTSTKKRERQEPKGRSWRKKRPISKKEEEEKQLLAFDTHSTVDCHRSL